MDEGGGVFLTNGQTDICDCMVAFATENEVVKYVKLIMFIWKPTYKFF